MSGLVWNIRFGRGTVTHGQEKKFCSLNHDSWSWEQNFFSEPSVTTPRPNILIGTVSHSPEIKFHISRNTHKKFGILYQTFAENQKICGIGQKEKMLKKSVRVWELCGQCIVCTTESKANWTQNMLIYLKQASYIAQSIRCNINRTLASKSVRLCKIGHCAMCKVVKYALCRVCTLNTSHFLRPARLLLLVKVSVQQIYYSCS